VLLKRSDAYVALSKPKEAKPDEGANAGWTSARVPRTPRALRSNTFSPRLGNASDGPPRDGSEEKITSPRQPEAEMIQELAEGTVITGWEKDNDGDKVVDDDEALEPRYDHTLMAGEHLRWDQKSHISLWELVH
jgi:hypothetical protein